MLSWVITCRNDQAQKILDALERKHGAPLQCRVVNFWRGLNSSMFSRMMCDALHEADSGGDVIFLASIAGASPYHVASLLSHKHSRCEVISGVTLPLIERMMTYRRTMTSSEFHGHIVGLGAPEMSSLWYQQQKNPPFVLKHNLYKY